MRLVSLLVLSAVIGCTVRERKSGDERSEDGSGKPTLPVVGPIDPGGGTVTVPTESGGTISTTDATATFKASLELIDAKVYPGETLTLRWSSDSSSCGLDAGSEDIGHDLPSTGTLNHTPSIDTKYELTCVNDEGKEAKISTKLKLLQEGEVVIPTFEKSELSRYLDINALLSGDCDKKGCLVADLEPMLFAKTATGWEETAEFVKKIAAGGFTLPPNRVQGIRSLSTAFDLSSSVVFGGQDQLKILGLDQKCSEGASLKSGDAIPSGGTLTNIIEDNVEAMSDAPIAFPIYTDLLVIGKERRGLIAKGSQLVVSYKTTDASAKISALYRDYETATGKFILSGTRDSSPATLLIASRNRIDDELRFQPVPAGYRLPAKGYGDDQNVFNPNDPICAMASQDVYHGLGSKTTYGPVSDYFPKYRSKRIVSGPATISCSRMFPFEADSRNLGSEWVANVSDALWFISDSNWPSCGGLNCLGKILYEIPYDDVRGEGNHRAEPYNNYCIDRWMGVSYDQYAERMHAACIEAPAYKAVTEKEQAIASDSSFFSNCSKDYILGCRIAMDALRSLAAIGSLDVIRGKVDQAQKIMEERIATNVSYVLTDELFREEALSSMHALVMQSMAMAPIIEAFRKGVNPPANWDVIFGNGQTGNAPAYFSSFKKTQETLEKYLALVTQMSALVKPSAKTVGCSFIASGRFRQFHSVSVGDVKIRTGSKMTKNASILSDFEVIDGSVP